MANNVLLFTSVIGGGHVFRDLAIAEELKRRLPADHQIIFASGGNAYKMLAAEPVKVEEISGLEFPAHLGTASFFKLYLIVLWSEILQILDLRRLVKKYDPVLVILDEYFFLADYCRFKGIPVVFMTDFAGVPMVPVYKSPVRAAIEAFFDWTVSWWLPRRVHKYIFIGDKENIPREEWRRRAVDRGIIIVEPITKVQYTAPPSREEARKRLGIGAGQKVVTVAVGCSGVGSYLLASANEAASLLQATVPNLSMQIVCGMGIDPEPLRAKAGPGVTVHGYVRNLEVMFAASDAAVVQCGLTTTTECLMIGVPTIVVPLADHWEQENTARYMVDKARAKRMPADTVTPERVASGIVELLSSEWKPVAPYKGDGHIVAAQLIADVPRLRQAAEPVPA